MMEISSAIMLNILTEALPAMFEVPTGFFSLLKLFIRSQIQMAYNPIAS